MLNEYTGSSMLDIELSEELRRNQEEHRRVICASIRSCCAGNYGAKETVKEIIKYFFVFVIIIHLVFLKKGVGKAHPF